MSNVEKKFWQGTNFWVAFALLAAGLSTVVIPDDLVRAVIMGASAFLSGLFLIREKVKGAGIDLKAWLASKNTWNYLATVVIAIVPTIPADLFTRLHELATAILGGNWQGIVTALFSIATMLYFIIKKPAVLKK